MYLPVVYICCFLSLFFASCFKAQFISHVMNCCDSYIFKNGPPEINPFHTDSTFPEIITKSP